MRRGAHLMPLAARAVSSMPHPQSARRRERYNRCRRPTAPRLAFLRPAAGAGAATTGPSFPDGPPRRPTASQPTTPRPTPAAAALQPTSASAPPQPAPRWPPLPNSPPPAAAGACVAIARAFWSSSGIARFAVSITPTKPTIGAFLAVTLTAAIFVN